MRIVYQLRDLDIIAFSNHILVQSSELPRRQRHVQWILPMAFLFFAIVLVIAGVDWKRPAALVAISLGWLWYQRPKRFWKSVDKEQCTELHASENRPSPTHRELIADDEYLIENSPLIELRMKWRAFAKCELINDYIFLHGMAYQCVIVPRDTITEGDFDQFAQYCAERIAAANSITS